MSSSSLSSRIFDALASLRLAVVVMVTLGGTCAYATFYEMDHGTPAVQRDIYQTPGFSLLLGLLGVNIFSVMMKRYPWKEHHVGFVMAHIGILILLAGSLISLHRGLDSNMPLYEGETTDRVTLLEKALFVSVPGMTAPGQFPVAFEKRPPAPGREQRFSVPGSDVTLVAEDYAAHVEVADTFRAGDGEPALHFTLQAPFATQDGWLSASSEGPSHLNFGPVSLGFHSAASVVEAEVMAKNPESKNQVHFVAAPGGVLLYGSSGETGAVTTGRVEVGKPVPTSMGAMTLTVDQSFERAARTRQVAPATPPAKEERRLSAVKVRLEGPAGKTAPPNGSPGPTCGACLRGGVRHPRLSRARGGRALQGHAPEVPLREVPGLEHARDLRELRARRRPGERLLRAPHLDEPPDALPRVHLLSSVVRGRHADDVDLLGSPRPGPSSRLSRGDPHRGGGRLDVLSEAVPRAAPSRPSPRSSP